MDPPKKTREKDLCRPLKARKLKLKRDHGCGFEMSTEDRVSVA